MSSAKALLASLWSCERDGAAAGPVPFPVEDVDSQVIFRERLQSWHHGVTSVSKDGERLLL